MIKILIGTALIAASFATAVFETRVPSNPAEVAINYNNLDTSIKKQVDCLTDNIYFEARNQPDAGKIAVAMVTMNRVQSKDYPKTVCGVVKQQKGGTCQFSWWCNSKMKAKAIAQRFMTTEEDMIDEIRQISMWVYFYHKQIKDQTNGATFYHATYVRPQWKNVEKTIKIGDHIFYRQRNGESWQ
jgi:spore germination cell wall hydrolase CwlJ-like protein